MRSIILYPLHIADFATPIFSIDDMIFDGIGQHNAKRSIFQVEDILLHKRQLLSRSRGGVMLNIIGTKPERRNYLSRLGFFDNLQIASATTIETTKRCFVFLPHNPAKQNYWHCLIDNVSQLVFIAQNCPDLHVFMPRTTGEMITNYVKHLQTIYDFDLTLISEKSHRFVGKVLMTQPSVQGEFVHNKDVAAKTLQLAEKQLAETNRVISKQHFKFGSVPHAFEVKNNEQSMTIKNYSIPWSTPLRKSTFSALQKLGDPFRSNSSPKFDVTYIKRVGGKQKNPINEEELLQHLDKNPKVQIVDFGTLSFSEQTRIAAQSKRMIGVHGAGLTNMVFMTPGSTIVDIMPPNYSLPVTTEFAWATKALGLGYVKIDGRLENANQEQGYSVNVEEVLKFLEKEMPV